MTDKTSLGDRMKQYESISQHDLMRRTPVIIRLDGRAFHTFTKQIKDPSLSEKHSTNTVFDPSLGSTPFSVKLHNVMVKTCIRLFDIQNTVFAYTQSDEISLLLCDWDTHETQQWFGGNLQKIVSISASMVTTAFNFYFQQEFDTVVDSSTKLAQFDSRAFNIPKEEVVNYFIWRQQDASRNSVQMYGRYFFSAKQMHGKNNNEVQDMLMLQQGKNWNDLPTWMKRGSAVYASNDGLVVDEVIPMFTQNRSYIEDHLTIKEQNEFDITVGGVI